MPEPALLIGNGVRHLRYFISVAEALHFSRAAKKLHVAQSALSRQIRDLEEEVGTLLLERTNRSVVLTHAGQVFLEEARRTIASANRAKMRAEQAARGEVGRLNIGYVLSATGAILTEAIRRAPVLILVSPFWLHCADLEKGRSENCTVSSGPRSKMRLLNTLTWRIRATRVSGPAETRDSNHTAPKIGASFH